MPEKMKCKKCRGSGEHRRGEKCGTCKGSGAVLITTFEDGSKVIKPAVSV